LSIRRSTSTVSPAASRTAHSELREVGRTVALAGSGTGIVPLPGRVPQDASTSRVNRLAAASASNVVRADPLVAGRVVGGLACGRRLRDRRPGRLRLSGRRLRPSERRRRRLRAAAGQRGQPEHRQRRRHRHRASASLDPREHRRSLLVTFLRASPGAMPDGTVLFAGMPSFFGPLVQGRGGALP
jgi:hypothetical protein